MAPNKNTSEETTNQGEVNGFTGTSNSARLLLGVPQRQEEEEMNISYYIYYITFLVQTISASVSFGLWQGNAGAGAFIFTGLLAAETMLSELIGGGKK